MSQPILKSGVRILRPGEYTTLEAAGPREDDRLQMAALLYSGMRYVEAQRFHNNPPWLDGSGFIFLPRTAILKKQTKQRERWIKLNERGRGIMPLFLKAKPLPQWQTWSDRLRRWAYNAGLQPDGLGPKTMRKTWESWLVSSYPGRFAEITLNQGHTGLTSIGHYLNMPFLPEDKEAMKEYVEGMF